MGNIKLIFAFIAIALITSSTCYAQEWAITYGGSDVDYAYSIQQTSDGGYIVAGYTTSYGAGNGDVWVFKLDANGEIPDCSAMGTSMPLSLIRRLWAKIQP